MTQYFDKHGTEIFANDRIRCEWAGTPGCGKDPTEGPASFVQPVEWYAKYANVLARADGTPILRYADGQDVRALDRYLCQGSEGTAPRELTKEMAAFDPKAWAVIVNDWAQCTLIRRAGENQLNAAIREATKPTPRCVACGSETYLCGQDGRCPECTLLVNEAVAPKTIAEAREQTTQWFVRDEEVEKSKDLKWVKLKTSSPEAEAIDRFADWLSQPTLSDRFDQFKSEVLRCLRENGAERARVSFDVTDGEPWALLGFGDFEDQMVVYGEDVIASVDIIVDAWVRALGRKALQK